MTHQSTGKNVAFLTSLILLNLVPVYGIFYWDWKSFDLIFLYWIENLAIGMFVILKMLIRPYPHLIQLLPVLLLIPFFIVHYGIFCLAHGAFIIHLFGDVLQHKPEFDAVITSVIPIIEERHLGFAIIALVVYQMIDWLRDIKEHGLGADKINIVMSSPYKRIMVLHFAIIGSGFLLAALNEPAAGLLLLIAIKIINDIHQWSKENLINKELKKDCNSKG